MRRWLLTLGDFGSELGTLALAVWDENSLNIERLKVYKFPSERIVFGKGFTGAKIYEDTLYVCGFNGVYTVDLESYKVRPWLVRDDLNDLHNLAFYENNDGDVEVWITNTGHDCVESFDLEGNKISTTQLRPLPGSLPNEPSDPYFDSDPDTPSYLQKLYDKVHPNSLVPSSSGVLVSRFADKCIAWLDGTIFCSLPAPPHDLSCWDNELWATTTDGLIWLLPETSKQHQAELVIDTFASTGRSGWCRGLAVHDEVLAVGLTRIVRMPRERWADRPFDSTVTGLLVIDRATNIELAFSNLQWLGNHPKLFEVVPL